MPFIKCKHCTCVTSRFQYQMKRLIVHSGAKQYLIEFLFIDYVFNDTFTEIFQIQAKLHLFLNTVMILIVETI